MLAETKARDVPLSVFHYIKIADFIYGIIKGTSVQRLVKMRAVDTLIP